MYLIIMFIPGAVELTKKEKSPYCPATSVSHSGLGKLDEKKTVP